MIIDFRLWYFSFAMPFMLMCITLFHRSSWASTLVGLVAYLKVGLKNFVIFSCFSFFFLLFLLIFFVLVSVELFSWFISSGYYGISFLSHPIICLASCRVFGIPNYKLAYCHHLG